jgi:hypothetical protein
MLTGTHKTQNGFGFDILERYDNNGDAFLNHIVRVTRHEICVLFMDDETREQSKQ